MKTLLLLITLYACGCANISGTRTAPDGSKLTVSCRRFLWASEGIKSAITDSSGLTFSLEVNKSNPDAQAIGAVAEGVAKGLASGANPVKVP